ncbi:MAG: hypothetical protein ACI8RD_011968 [Bacillariaceae sp.]|jgi:hypothetical protein
MFVSSTRFKKNLSPRGIMGEAIKEVNGHFFKVFTCSVFKKITEQNTQLETINQSMQSYRIINNDGPN